MTARERYFFNKAQHAKKRKRKNSEESHMPPNLRRQTQAEQRPDTIGYTGTVGGGVR